jgi:hypothetical protein
MTVINQSTKTTIPIGTPEGTIPPELPELFLLGGHDHRECCRIHITDGIRPLVGIIGTPEGVIAMGVIAFEVHEPSVENLFINSEMTRRH